MLVVAVATIACRHHTILLLFVEKPCLSFEQLLVLLAARPTVLSVVSYDSALVVVSRSSNLQVPVHNTPTVDFTSLSSRIQKPSTKNLASKVQPHGDTRHTFCRIFVQRLSKVRFDKKIVLTSVRTKYAANSVRTDILLYFLGPLQPSYRYSLLGVGTQQILLTRSLLVAV
jgi:hypothetical protein